MENKFSNIKTDTQKVLYYILLSGGVMALSVLSPKLPYEILKSYLRNKKFDQSKFNRDLGRLYNRGDVRIGNDTVSITKKGKERVLKYKLEEIEIKKPAEWDKKWRLVVFDIPNPRRKVSNTLRHKLNNLGFIQYQKSIFIHPFDCRGEIDFIREVYEVGGNVKLIVAESIDDEVYFMRKFHLIEKK